MKKQEYKEWYENCEFIQQDMQFYSFQDAILNLDKIKYYYVQLPAVGKKLYQWYVFANVNIGKKQKEFLWDLINQNISSQN